MKLTAEEHQRFLKNKFSRDYLYQYAAVEEFYAHAPTKEGLLEAAGELEGKNYPREELCIKLLEINQALKMGSSTIENIKKLQDPKTLCVLTGQQSALGGGPLYTYFKAVSTIKLAKYCSEELGIETVPVFWSMSEDHDIEEVNNCHLVHGDSLKRIKFESKHPRRPFWDIEVPGEIADKFKEALPEGEHKKELTDLLETLSNCTLAKHFNGILAQLFRESGLIISGSNHIKDLAKDIALQELEKNLSSQVLQTGDLLQAKGYEAAFSENKAPNLFLYQERQRLKLKAKDENYFLKDQESPLSRQEVAKYIEENEFSFGAILRPLAQDKIFPTIAYVGGPSEIAYFAELKEIYKDLSIPMPVLFPRASLTLIDKEAHAIFKRFNLKEDQLIIEDKDIDPIIQKNTPKEFQAIMDEFSSSEESTLDQLSSKLKEYSPGLEATLEKHRDRLAKDRDKLKAKIKNQYLKNIGLSRKDLENAKNHSYPRSKLQERVLSPLQFYPTHGAKELYDLIYNAIDLFDFSHQVITL